MAGSRILILYATAGAGHKKAAEAIYHAAGRRSLDTELIDILDYMHPFVARLYSKGYTFLISRLKWLWGIFFFLSDAPLLSIFNIHSRRFLNALLCKRLLAFLKERSPEVVISTHFLSSEAVSFAKAKFNIKTRLITVITDFGVHNFWLAPYTDLYCCATQVTADILRKKGVSEPKIKITGLPLDEKFLTEVDRNKLSQEFAIDADAFTVLIVTGGIGVGPIEEMVDLLKGEAQLLVVCGHNNNLCQRIAKKGYSRVHAFGFVDCMEELMGISDLIVTKAGGLTITESLSKGLPMIFFFLIPGQELNNARVIVSNGAGIIVRTPRQIKDLILSFKQAADSLNVYKEKARLLAKPNSCQEILSLLSR